MVCFHDVHWSTCTSHSTDAIRLGPAQQRVVAQLGQAFSFTVLVLGEPAPSMEWTNIDYIGRVGNWLPTGVVQSGPTLSAVSATQEMAGHYQLRAFNSYGSAVSEIELVVEGEQVSLHAVVLSYAHHNYMIHGLTLLEF